MTLNLPCRFFTLIVCVFLCKILCAVLHLFHFVFVRWIMDTYHEIERQRAMIFHAVFLSRCTLHVVLSLFRFFSPFLYLLLLCGVTSNAEMHKIKGETHILSEKYTKKSNRVSQTRIKKEQKCVHA